jgi:hypothetical protein
LAQLCYTTSGKRVSNITPGVFFYYTFITAPSASFCIDIVQTTSCSGFSLFAIQQGNQISLYDNNCNKVAGGTEVSAGQGRVCISNAVPGAQYVLSVKYDSKSVQGSTFTGSAPVCQYNFESRINGATINNSQGSINLTPNCSSGNVTTMATKEIAPENSTLQAQLNVFPNPAAAFVNLSFVPSVSGNSSITLYDVSGKLVSYLYNGNTEEGKLYQRKINTKNFAAGIYIIQFRNGEFIETRKLIIAK